MFGESYGTTRSAVLVNVLETERVVDFNGVILLSQILNFNLQTARSLIRVELPYQLALNLRRVRLVSPQTAGYASGTGAASGGGRAVNE
jgi:carboxypeptidase C (cathepsin A)